MFKHTLLSNSLKKQQHRCVLSDLQPAHSTPPCTHPCCLLCMRARIYAPPALLLALHCHTRLPASHTSLSRVPAGPASQSPAACPWALPLAWGAAAASLAHPFNTATPPCRLVLYELAPGTAPPALLSQPVPAASQALAFEMHSHPQPRHPATGCLPPTRCPLLCRHCRRHPPAPLPPLYSYISPTLCSPMLLTNHYACKTRWLC
jgi:hypothetical protein